MYKHILITTDGSELAARGLDHGFQLAKSLGAEVSVVNVIVPLTGLAFEAVVESTAIDLYDRQTKEEAEKLEADTKKKAADIGLPINFVRVNYQFPAEAIIETAAKRGCDLIVMSSHGRRGLSRMILGSQTAEVLAESKLPVLVVR